MKYINYNKYNKLVIKVICLFGLSFPCYSFAELSEAGLVGLENKLAEFHKNCGHDLESNKNKCDTDAIELDKELNKMRGALWENIAPDHLGLENRCLPLNGTKNLSGGLYLENARQIIKPILVGEGIENKENRKNGKKNLVIKATQLLNSNGAKIVKEWSSKGKKDLNSVEHKSHQDSDGSNLECNENEVKVDAEMLHSQEEKLKSLQMPQLELSLESHQDSKRELNRRIQKAKLKLGAIQYLNKLLEKRKCVDNDLFNDFIATVLKFHGSPVSLTYDDAYILNQKIHDNLKKWEEEAKSAPVEKRGWIDKDLTISGHEGQSFSGAVELHSTGKMRIKFKKWAKGEKWPRLSYSDELLGEGTDMQVVTVISKGREGLKLGAESRVKNVSGIVDPLLQENLFTSEGKTHAMIGHYAKILGHIQKEARDKSGIMRAEIFEKSDGTQTMEQPAYDGNLWDFNKLDRAEILEIYHQFAVGLRNLHAVKIVHRDVKEENVLVRGYGRKDSPRKPKAVVADLGYAMILDPNNSKEGARLEVLGTPHTYAPELWDPIRGKNQEERQNRILKRDVYAFGLEFVNRLEPLNFEVKINGKKWTYDYNPYELCVQNSKINIGSPKFAECYKEMAKFVYQSRLNMYHEKYHGKPPTDSFEKLSIDCIKPNMDERPTMDEVVARYEVLAKEEKFERLLKEQGEKLTHH